MISWAAFAQESNCGNGIDDDGDGFIDCYDGDCAANATCINSFIGVDKPCQTPPPPTNAFGMKLAFSSPNQASLTLGVVVVGDLDRDGLPDVVTVHSAQKTITILKGSDLSVKTTISTLYQPEYFDHAIANISNDNCAEIFIAEFDGTNYYVTSYDCKGTFLWRTKAFGKPYDLALADFNQDGKPELYYRNEILDAKTGAVLVAGTGDWNTIDSGPVAVDVLAGNGLELVLGGEIFTVSLGGSLALAKKFNNIPTLGGITYFPKFNGSYITSQTSVADFNLDGKLDIVMNGATSASSTSTTTIFFWDVANNNFKTYQPKQSNGSSWYNGAGRVNLADIDGDGKMNAVFVSGSRLFALNDDFSLKWFVTISELTSGFTSTTVFDFNNDGASEIVYRDEANLYIIDGKTGNAFATTVCKSRTANEYPIVADVDNDGATEICVSCATDDAQDINDLTLVGQGQIRMYKSSTATPWVPSRKVWNQHAYFNVNVNDDLTIPRVQQSSIVTFSSGVCTTGANRALNNFLNQSGILDSKGCKTYPATDLTIQGALTFTTPVCPTTDFPVTFTIKNIGDLALAGNFPITFYNGDPTKPGATKLNTQTVLINSLKPDSLFTVKNMNVKGTGGTFTLYISINDNGTTTPTPITQPNTSFIECIYTNNFLKQLITPTNFKLTTAFKDQQKCGSQPSANNGSAQAYKLEGALQVTAGYTFYWYNGATTGSIASAVSVGPQYNNLAAGTYSVFSVNNATGCMSDPEKVTLGVVIKVFAGADIKVDQVYDNCGNPNGKVTVTPKAPALVIDYNYEWYSGAVVGSGSILSKSNVLSGAKGGTYSVLVSDKTSNCTTILTADVPDQTVIPQIAAVDVTTVAAQCNPANSGSASASVGGVTAGFTFKWYNGANKKPSPDFVGATFTGLLAGSYTVEANNTTSGCVSNTFTVVVGTATGIVAATKIDSQQISCDPTTPNGVASANVGGVTVGYKFQWYKGFNTVVSPIVGATNSQVTGLVAGSYTVLVTNNIAGSPDFGCSNSKTVNIADAKTQPNVTTKTVKQSTCNPANGSAEVTATTDTSAGTFSYYWYNGNVGSPVLTFPPADGTGTKYPSYQPTFTLVNKGLTAGSYTLVAVNDATKCPSNRIVLNIGDITNTPGKNGNSININKTDNTSCDVTQLNSSASATINGATAGYSFKWFTGNTTAGAPVIATPVNSNIISKLVASSYTVEVTNTASTCTGTNTTSISDKSQKPSLSLAKSDNSSCNAAIFLGFIKATFVANPNPAPSTSDYIYSWTAKIPATAPTFGSVPGAGTTDKIAGLNGGEYSVTVLNNITHCASTAVNAIIGNSPVPPTIGVAQTGSTNCPGGAANGVVTLTVTSPNSEAPDQITYQWYKGKIVNAPDSIMGAHDRILSAQQGGPSNYFTVDVKSEVSDCKNTATVLLQDISSAPVLKLNKVDNKSCTPLTTGVLYTGSVSKNSITDGNNTGGHKYTYNWYSGTGTGTPLTGQPATVTGQTTSASNKIINLNGGSYTATVTNETLNCVSNPVTVTVNNNLTLPDISLTSTPSTTCSAPANGELSVVINNIGSPTDSYTYAWSNGTTHANQVGSTQDGIIGLAVANNYSVTVTNDKTACLSNATQNVVDNSSLPVLTVTTTSNNVCAESTSPLVKFSGTLVGKNTDVNKQNNHMYRYDWNSTSTNATATSKTDVTQATLPNVKNGSYTVTVTNTTLRCTSNPITAVVADATVLPTITLSSIGSTNCAIGVGKENGSVTVTSPTSLASYAWYTGTTATGVPLLSTTVTQGTLQGGTGKNYTVLVTTTATNCAKPATLLLADNSAKPVISLSTTPNGICAIPPATDFNGTVIATVPTDVNKKPGHKYIYNWYDGPTTASPAITPATNSFVPTTTSTLTKRKAGTYTATITNDDLGCVSNAVSTTVVDNKIFPALTTSVVSKQTSCDALNPLGQLKVDVTNQGSPSAGKVLGNFDYTWYSGVGVTAATMPTPTAVSTTSNTSSTSNLTTLIPTGLAKGDYTVNVTDRNTGCLSTKSFFLPDLITFPIVPTITPTSVTACFVTNGEILVATPVAVSSKLTDQTKYTLYYLHESETSFGSGLYNTTTNNATVVGSPTVSVAVNGGSKIFTPSSPNSANDANTFADYSLALNPKNLVPGNYTVVIQDAITKCLSSPVTKNVIDNTNKVISISAITGASSCATNNGTLDISAFSPVGVPPFTYTYQLYLGGPQNTDFIFMNKIKLPTFLDASNVIKTHDSFTTPGAPAADGQYLGNAPATNYNGSVTNANPPIMTALGPGLYTVVVTDQTGCGKAQSYIVPALNAPDQTITVQNSTKCDNALSDGNLSVSLTNKNASTINNYTITVFNSLKTDNMGIPNTPIFTGPILGTNLLSMATVAIPITGPPNLYGDFIVQIYDDASGCTGYNPATIKTLVKKPLISIDDIIPNTACIPGAADGSVKLTVTQDPTQLSITTLVPPETPLLPTPLPGAGPIYQINNISPAPILAYTAALGTGTPITTPYIGGLYSNTSYTFTIEETLSGCITDQIVIIPDAPEIPDPITVVATDESYCAPIDATGGTGKVEVTAVPATFAFADYQFDYYAQADPTLVTPLYSGIAATVFDRTQAGWINGATTGKGNTQSYYVKATKKTGKGIGCVAPIETATVKDVHVEPQATISSLPDTSCAGAAEGTVALLTNTTGFPAFPTTKYTYKISPDDNAVGTLTGQDGGSTYTYLNMKGGTVGLDYTVLITNETSGCQTSPTITVAPTKFPLSIVTASKTDQLFCSADGSIAVTKIELDQSVKGITPVTQLTPTYTGANGFDFNWFKTTSQPFGDPSALNDGVTTVTGELLDKTGYPSMGFGDYYVIAHRKLTATEAKGCDTPPFKVHVNDTHTNPSPTITAFPNTSCDPTVGEGELKISVADNTGGTFAYSWALTSTNVNNTVLPAASTGNIGSGSGPNDDILNKLEGTYTLTATNETTQCVSTSQVNLNANPYVVTITKAVALDQLICKPDGSVTITEVQLDKTAKSLSPPPVKYTGAAIAEYQFNWFKTTSGTFGSNVPSPRLVDGASSVITVSSISQASNYTSLVADTYYAIAKKTTTEGFGCFSAPYAVKVQDRHKNPSIVLSTLSNTACNTFFDGQLSYVASDSTVRASSTVLAGLPYTYSYAWLPSPIVVPPSVATPANDGGTGTITGLKEGQYKIRVKNETTGCVLDSARTEILKNALPVFVEEVKIIDRLFCAPSGNSTITNVTYKDRNGTTVVPPLTEFDYTWYNDPSVLLASQVVTNSISLDSASFLARTAGSYYAVATRKATVQPGAGCASAPFKIIIEDKSQNPTVSFKTSPQTICTTTDAFYDGSITVFPFTGNIKFQVQDVALSTPGNIVYKADSIKYFAASNFTNPPTTPLYDFVWSNFIPNAYNTTNSNPLATITNATNVASYTTTLPADKIAAGFYDLVVTNKLNLCSSKVQTVEVLLRQPTIAVLEVLTLDQSDCSPVNGAFTKIKIDDGTTTSNDDPRPSPFLVPYYLAWTNNGSSFTYLSPTVPGLAANPAGQTYGVVATKKGGVGSGCVSTLFPVELKDITEKPAVDITSIANYACINTLGNGSISASVTTNDGITSTPGLKEPLYSFQWKDDALPIPNLISNAKNGNKSTAINLFTGNYSVSVTDQSTPNLGCVSTVSGSIGQEVIQFNSPLASTPQVNCPPTQDGSIQVTFITEKVRGDSVTYTMSTPGDRARYNFEWFDSKGISKGAPKNGAANGNLLDKQLAGEYTVKFTNSLGCLSLGTGGIIIDKTSLPTIKLDNFTTPTICLIPERTGSFQISADGSFDTSGYDFEWHAGSTLTDPLIVGNTSPSLEGVLNSDPLTYTVKVTNKATNCYNKDTYIFAVEPITIRALASSVPLASCLADDGTLFGATEEGVSSSYTYAWYSGDFTKDPTVITKTPVYTIKEVNTAPIGTFTVVAKHPTIATCVSEPASIAVGDARVYPKPKIVQIAPLTYCDPAKANGVARATVNDGIIGYTFDWFKGKDIKTPSIYTGSEAQGLLSVLYTAKATDIISGCFDTDTLTIEDKKNLIPAPIIKLLSDRTNCVDKDGGLSASVDGAIDGYTFRWYDGKSVGNKIDYSGVMYTGLDAGFFTTTVIENISGCVSKPATAEVKVAKIIPDFDVRTKPTNCEQNIGEAVYVQLNDTPIASIEWDLEGSTEVYTGSILSGLPKGIFKVTATSEKKCVFTKSIQILPEILVFNGVSSNNDGQNEVFEIACIQDFPNNHVQIFNRQGTIVYEVNGYNNVDVAFKGISNKGISLLGTELPVGTYFYIIDKRDGSQPRSGYLELLR